MKRLLIFLLLAASLYALSPSPEVAFIQIWMPKSDFLKMKDKCKHNELEVTYEYPDGRYVTLPCRFLK